MSDHTEDIVRRLDAAITGLKSEFVAAQHGLTQQISATNARLGNLIRVLSSKAGQASVQEGEPEIQFLRQALAEHERQAGASAQHIAELERTVAELKTEIATLRSQEAWLVAANQDMSEHLVESRAQTKSYAKTVESAHAEAEKVQKRLAAEKDLACSLKCQLEEARAALHEDPEAVRRLTAEVTSLRKANMCLRAALEDSEAKMAAKERQQQILLETLVTNGQMRKMGEILVGAGVITREQLQEALTEQEASPERMLGAILVEKGQVREEDVAQAVACQARLPVVDLSEKMVSPEAARLLDEALCKKHQCIPVRTTQDQVFLAMTNPRDSAAMAATERASGRRVVPLVATPSGICCAINTVFGVH